MRSRALEFAVMLAISPTHHERVRTTLEHRMTRVAVSPPALSMRVSGFLKASFSMKNLICARLTTCGFRRRARALEPAL